MWESFIYAFDPINVPALDGISLSPGQELQHIPLVLESDADFLLCAVKISGTTLQVKLETAWTDPLMDDFLPPSLYASDVFETALEAPIHCPAGSVISLSLRGI